MTPEEAIAFGFLLIVIFGCLHSVAIVLVEMQPAEPDPIGQWTRIVSDGEGLHVEAQIDSDVAPRIRELVERTRTMGFW